MAVNDPSPCVHQPANMFPTCMSSVTQIICSQIDQLAHSNESNSRRYIRALDCSADRRYIWKVRPKHVSALFLRHLQCARQPMIGRRDVSFLAGMLDFPVSKYYLASADTI